MRFFVGDLTVGTMRTVKFRVTLNDAIAPTTITNRGTAFFMAASGGVTAPVVNVESNEVRSDVVLPVIDMAALSDLLVTSDDLGTNDDLSSLPPSDDLAAVVDLTTTVDLVLPPDGSGTFTPGPDLSEEPMGKPQGGCGCTTSRSDDRRGTLFGVVLLGVALLLRRPRRPARAAQLDVR